MVIRSASARLAVACTVTLLLAWTQRSEAQTFSSILAGGYAWTTSANWGGPAFPNAIDATASLSGNGGVAKTVTLGQTITVGTIYFSGSDAYTIAPAGGVLALDMTGIGTASIQVASGAAAQTISANITTSDHLSITQDSSTGGLTLGSLTISTARTVSLSGVGNVTLGGILVNSAGASLTISNATVGTAGGLRIMGNVAAASGNLTLTLTGSAMNTTFDGSLNLWTTGTTGTLSVANGGLTVLNGGATLNNVSVTNGSTLRIGNAGASFATVTLNGVGSTLELGNVSLSGALGIASGGGERTLSMAIGATNATLAGNITQSSAAGALHLAAGTGQTLTLSGVVGGSASGGYVKEGDGTVVFAGANSYTSGAISVGGGTLQLNSSRTYGTLSGIGTATLQASAGSSNTFSMFSVATGSMLTLGGTGSLTFNSPNQVTGTLIVNNSNIRWNNLTLTTGGSTLVLGSGVTVAAANSLSISNSTGGIDAGTKTLSLLPGASNAQATFAGNIANASTASAWIVADESGQTLTLAGSISGGGSLTKVGGGTLEFAGNTSTYSGETTISGGLLSVSGDWAGSTSGVIHVTGGTFRGDGSIARSVSLSGGTISLASTGVLAHSNGLTVVGGGTWAGTGSVVGAVTVSSGTLDVTGVLSANTVLAINSSVIRNSRTSGGAFNVTSGSTLLLADNSTYELANGVSSAVGVTITGSGAVRTVRSVSGASSTYSGTITVSSTGANEFQLSGNGGTLYVGGNITGSGGSGVNIIGGGTVVLAGTNNYSGNTTISNGTLRLLTNLPGASTLFIASSGVLTGTATVGGVTTLSGGTISFASGGNIANALNVIAGGNWNGVGSVVGATTVSSGTFTVAGTLSTSALDVASTLNVGGTITGPANITGNVVGAGSIHGNSTLSGGTISFATGGSIAGTLFTDGGNWNGLGGVTGLVTQNGGTFNVNGGANLDASGGYNLVSGNLFTNGSIGGNVTVAGGTLGGSGAINGTVTVNSGELSPGNSPGMLTLADLEMNGGDYLWQLGTLTTSGPGTNFDFVLVDGGDADLSNTAGVVLDFSLLDTLDQPGPDNAFWLSDHTWTILSAINGGLVNGTFADMNQVVDLGGFGTGVFSLGYDTTNVFLNYNVAAVPEPGSLLLATLGAAGFGIRRWRRKAQARTGN